ncbi:MAG: DHHW family protein [Proteocatella sp.]
MNKIFRTMQLAAAMLLVILFGISMANIRVAGPDIMAVLKRSGEDSIDMKAEIQELENIVNEKVFQKKSYIETYGYLQKLMDKDEESKFSVVKDTDGNLHYTYFATGPNDTKAISGRVSDFAKELDVQGTKLVYLMTPDKYLRGITQFPKGIPYSYANETADAFLAELEDKNVDAVDFRENITSIGIPKNEIFFKTDHHWTIESTFWAFQELVGELNKKFGLKLDEDNRFREIENYNKVKYPDSYLGSMGRKAGISYGGIDDFTLIYPKFKTDYLYYSDSGSEKIQLEGRFEDSLILTYPFNADLDVMEPEADKYFAYLLGNRPLVNISNRENPDGLRVLFIKDSLIVPVAAFFSSVCSQMDLIDPRYFKGDIEAYAKEGNYDFVFVSIYPQNLVDEFFPYFKK